MSFIGRELAILTEVLANKLFHLGFSIVPPAEHSLDEQINIFNQAEIIVAPHGAGLTNVVWCNPGTVVYELFCDQYINH